MATRSGGSKSTGGARKKSAAKPKRAGASRRRSGGGRASSPRTGGTRAVPRSFGRELAIANLHASAGSALRTEAEREVARAALVASDWAGDTPLLFGGDLNLRPAESRIFDLLASEPGLAAPTAPDSLDHLLVAGLEIDRPAAAWPANRREVATPEGAIRLSDHAPVEAAFG